MPAKTKSRLIKVPSHIRDYTDVSKDKTMLSGRRCGAYFYLCIPCGDGRGFANNQAMLDNKALHLCTQSHIKKAKERKQ
jgi:hypothetical protein